MKDIKHPAADTLDDKRTYAVDIDMSKDAAEEAKPGTAPRKKTRDDAERENADALAAATSQSGQT